MGVKRGSTSPIKPPRRRDDSLGFRGGGAGVSAVLAVARRDKIYELVAAAGRRHRAVEDPDILPWQVVRYNNY